MPKLLQINVTANSGSTGRIAEEIGQLAISQGWESYIAYGRNAQPSKSNVIRVGSDFGVKVHGVQSRLFDNHGLASVCATRKLIKQIEGIKPDVIHLHNIHGYYLNYEILFKYLSELETPIIWTLHDCWSFTGHCSHFEFVGCDRWKTGCFDCPQKKSYPASILLDNSKRNYRLKKKYFNSIKNLTLVTVSDWLNNLVQQSFITNCSYKRIYNGVNLEVFKPLGENANKAIREKYEIGNRFMLLGVASVWDDRKGLKDFVRLNELIDDDTCIVLVGLNENQLSELPKGIVGIKRTENIGQLAQIYSASDIFLNPTYEDNFPTTNLESLACGTCVVTYKTGGSIEAVSDDTGYIVNQGDLNKVVGIINEMKLKDKSQISAACRQRAVDLYNKDDRYAEYLELYNNQ